MRIYNHYTISCSDGCLSNSMMASCILLPLWLYCTIAYYMFTQLFENANSYYIMLCYSLLNESHGHFEHGMSISSRITRLETSTISITQFLPLFLTNQANSESHTLYLLKRRSSLLTSTSPKPSSLHLSETASTR